MKIENLYIELIIDDETYYLEGKGITQALLEYLSREVGGIRQDPEVESVQMQISSIDLTFEP